VTTLRQRIGAGEKLVGLFSSIGSPAAVEIVGGAGFDFLCIDSEHSQLDRAAVEELIRAADASAVPALVRVAGHHSELIASALDAGAAGVIVPRVGTAAEAAAIVKAFRYPPAGERGVGPGRASGYGYAIGPYLARANDTLLLAIQVETAQAVDNLDAILAVDGIDLVFIGPGDLSVSLGLFGPANAEKLGVVIEKIVAKAVAKGRAVGMFRFSPDDIAIWAKRGASLFIVSSDAFYLATGARTVATAALQQLGRAPAAGGSP
jgi:4-hydroxy-2-oxoheptanedioate aldolase